MINKTIIEYARAELAKDRGLSVDKLGYIGFTDAGMIEPGWCQLQFNANVNGVINTTMGYDFFICPTHIRKKLALTRDEFGVLLGVSGRTVEAWEQGRRNPGTSSLILMNNILRKETV